MLSPAWQPGWYSSSKTQRISSKNRPVGMARISWLLSGTDRRSHSAEMPLVTLCSPACPLCPPDPWGSSEPGARALLMTAANCRFGKRADRTLQDSVAKCYLPSDSWSHLLPGPVSHIGWAAALAQPRPQNANYPVPKRLAGAPAFSPLSLLLQSHLSPAGARGKQWDELPELSSAPASRLAGSSRLCRLGSVPVFCQEGVDPRLWVPRTRPCDVCRRG